MAERTNQPCATAAISHQTRKPSVLKATKNWSKSLPCTRRKVCNILWCTAPSRGIPKTIPKKTGKSCILKATKTELLAKSQTSEAELSHLADEKTAEDLRLLYVALTRAEEQLNIYAAANKNCTPNNPFAYLLEGLPDAGRESVSQSYKSATDVVEMLKTNWQRFITNNA